jgi:hypothetical protein
MNARSPDPPDSLPLTLARQLDEDAAADRETVERASVHDTEDDSKPTGPYQPGRETATTAPAMPLMPTASIGRSSLATKSWTKSAREAWAWSTVPAS